MEKIILELSFRYRPQAADQQSSYATKVAALIHDVSDVPPGLLRKACTRWINDRKWLPKASELIEIAKGIGKGQDVSGFVTKQTVENHVAELNRCKFVTDSGILYFVNYEGHARVDRAI